MLRRRHAAGGGFAQRSVPGVWCRRSEAAGARLKSWRATWKDEVHKAIGKDNPLSPLSGFSSCSRSYAQISARAKRSRRAHLHVTNGAQMLLDKSLSRKCCVLAEVSRYSAWWRGEPDEEIAGIADTLKRMKTSGRAGGGKDDVPHEKLGSSSPEAARRANCQRRRPSCSSTSAAAHNRCASAATGILFPRRRSRCGRRSLRCCDRRVRLRNCFGGAVSFSCASTLAHYGTVARRLGCAQGSGDSSFNEAATDVRARLPR